MLWPLTWAVIIGTLPGVFIGAWVRIEYLPNPKNFKFFVGVVLLYIGWRLLVDVVKSKNKHKDKGSPSNPVSSHVVDVITSTVKQVKFEYDGDIFKFSPPIIYSLCFLVGSQEEFTESAAARSLRLFLWPSSAFRSIPLPGQR